MATRRETRWQISGDGVRLDGKPLPGVLSAVVLLDGGKPPRVILEVVSFELNGVLVRLDDAEVTVTGRDVEPVTPTVVTEHRPVPASEEQLGEAPGDEDLVVAGSVSE